MVSRCFRKLLSASLRRNSPDPRPNETSRIAQMRKIVLLSATQAFSSPIILSIATRTVKDLLVGGTPLTVPPHPLARRDWRAEYQRQ